MIKGSHGALIGLGYGVAVICSLVLIILYRLVVKREKSDQTAVEVMELLLQRKLFLAYANMVWALAAQIMFVGISVYATSGFGPSLFFEFLSILLAVLDLILSIATSSWFETLI